MIGRSLVKHTHTAVIRAYIIQGLDYLDGIADLLGCAETLFMYKFMEKMNLPGRFRVYFPLLLLFVLLVIKLLLLKK